jgi:hypothetical protein
MTPGFEFFSVLVDSVMDNRPNNTAGMLDSIGALWMLEQPTGAQDTRLRRVDFRKFKGELWPPLLVEYVGQWIRTLTRSVANGGKVNGQRLIHAGAMLYDLGKPDFMELGKLWRFDLHTHQNLENFLPGVLFRNREMFESDVYGKAKEIFLSSNFDIDDNKIRFGPYPICWNLPAQLYISLNNHDTKFELGVYETCTPTFRLRTHTSTFSRHGPGMSICGYHNNLVPEEFNPVQRSEFLNFAGSFRRWLRQYMETNVFCFNYDFARCDCMHTVYGRTIRY